MSNKTNPLENLEGELVDYVSNTPNNINPSIVRSMVRVAADNVSEEEMETMWIAAIERGDTPVTKLPAGLTSIGDYAFQKCTNLTLTSLPAELMSIGKAAFSSCTNLALTSLPAELMSIGDYAFVYCTNLALTSLPEGITKIKDSTFESCTNLALTSLPAGLTSIGQYAFAGCASLALTSLPEGITGISWGAFSGCTGLTKLTFKGTPTGTIANTAFKDCTNLKTINVPWARGVVSGAPWGATNATINYNYTGG